jgi:hypothetical protein
LLINVTQDDINNGIQETCGNCPVALALKRAFSTKFVFVDIHEIHVCCEVYLPSSETEQFIRLFDILGPAAVKPFSFFLETETPSPLGHGYNQ